MKKKIIALSICVALLAVAAVGTTFAYFTDTDEEENCFTIGGVSIKLGEKERSEDGSSLVDFQQDKVLMPIVGSAQGDKEDVDGVSGLPLAANYVDKIITVENTGKSQAYVRVFIAIPVLLDNVDDPSQNVLHFNWNTQSTEEGQWLEEECVAENVSVNGVQCNVYSRIYSSVLDSGEETETPAYIGFYLDKNVDMDEGVYTINGEIIEFNFEDGISIPVFAQGIQAAGFENAEEAFQMSGLPDNPWE